MPHPHSRSFNFLYPDVDPRTGLATTAPERTALALAFAVLAFGAVTGDLIVGGVGVVLATGASIAQSRKTPRRIRSEARARFPEQDWAENESPAFIPIAVGVFVAAIATLCVAGFWWVPDRFTTAGGAIIAALVAVLVWFMPGLNPVWTRTRTRHDAPTIDTAELHLSGLN
ncbi:hypothetical protein [Corynebacterium renale]|uniref:Uncharacterized protein n=1 Tax=Corynebacterium renale TaxID=1724 RepID=A0A2A9DNH0_9CORY|nr:hypothetical protein [Corynebacterium renale]PFG27715.1 hypothetical protein ATK06_0791 [Corynebacterium renale]SQI22219.1 cell-surface hemin receptor [Corynebacterium renale]